MNSVQLFEKLYFKKEFSELFDILQGNEDEKSLYIIGKIYFEQGDLDKAIKFFEKSKAYFEVAKCKFLKKDLFGAKLFLNKIQEKTIASEWLSFLIDVIENKVKKYPTFFQVRNFLEVDLSLLFETNNIEYAEKIINCSYFVEANAEANKFFARVLYNYEYIGLSQIFLDKSLDIFYKDPETHFIKAQCFLKENNIEDAKKHLNYCLEYADNYFPARKLLKELN